MAAVSIAIFALAGIVASGSVTLSPRITGAGTRVASLPDQDIRDCTPPFFVESTDTWHMCCTVINGTVGPSGYPGEVGMFTFTNATLEAKKKWTFIGIVVPRGEVGEWDQHGVFTPGFIFDDKNEQYVVFYGGVGANYPTKTGSYFSECLGVATSSSPSGPFVKSKDPFVCGCGPPTARHFSGRFSEQRDPAMYLAGLASEHGVALPSQCEHDELAQGLNIPGDDFTHFPASSAEECKTYCCRSAGKCIAYTWAKQQPESSPGCPAGSSCCWLKSTVTGAPAKQAGGLQSGYVNGTLPPGQQWPWIRADNPRPVVFNGRRELIFKGVAANFTALPNLWAPGNGTGTSSWAQGPYTAPDGVSNPVVRPQSPWFPDGFENQEFFRAPAPDGRIHMIASTHGGSRSNVHLVQAPGDVYGQRWDVAEDNPPGWSEPTFVAAGVPGDALEPPRWFARFEASSECPAGNSTGSSEGGEAKSLLVVCLYELSWVEVQPPR